MNEWITSFIDQLINLEQAQSTFFSSTETHTHDTDISINLPPKKNLNKILVYWLINSLID